MSVTYALVSDLDNKSTMLALKGKGVKDDSCIYLIQNTNTLIKKLQTGDTVVVISIDRFGSVVWMVQIFEYLRQNGVAFKSIQEPYLEFRDGKELKRGVVEYLNQLCADEASLIKGIEATCKNPNYTAHLSRQVRLLCLRVVQRTFAEKGLIRRKS